MPVRLAVKWEYLRLKFCDSDESLKLQTFSFWTNTAGLSYVYICSLWAKEAIELTFEAYATADDKDKRATDNLLGVKEPTSTGFRAWIILMLHK